MNSRTWKRRNRHSVQGLALAVALLSAGCSAPHKPDPAAQSTETRVLEAIYAAHRRGALFPHCDTVATAELPSGMAAETMRAKIHEAARLRLIGDPQFYFDLLELTEQHRDLQALARRCWQRLPLSGQVLGRQTS